MFRHLPRGFRAPSETAPASIPVRVAFPVRGVAQPYFQPSFFMEDGPMFDPYKIPGSRSLHDRRNATWALLVGETHSSAVHAEMRRRPHRGMLPDVDFSRAVQDPSRPSLVRRLMGLFRRGGARAARKGEELSASSHRPVGETARSAYIARIEAGDSGHPPRSRIAMPHKRAA